MAGKGSVNKVILVGNLGRDPELRHLPDGTAVVNFTLATTESWRREGAEAEEHTEWHRVSFFGRVAEVIHQYARKGSKLYVEGSLRTRKWQDKEGHDRWTTELRGRDFTFLSGRDSAPAGDAPAGAPTKAAAPPNDDPFGGMDDDVPF